MTCWVCKRVVANGMRIRLTAVAAELSEKDMHRECFKKWKAKAVGWSYSMAGRIKRGKLHE